MDPNNLGRNVFALLAMMVAIVATWIFSQGAMAVQQIAVLVMLLIAAVLGVVATLFHCTGVITEKMEEIERNALRSDEERFLRLAAEIRRLGKSSGP